jgi:hypothetical protein
LTRPSIDAHGDPIKLYQRLFDEESVEFDLTEGRPAFKMNKDMTVETRKEFKRRVEFHQPLGERDDYFKY